MFTTPEKDMPKAARKQFSLTDIFSLIFLLSAFTALGIAAKDPRCLLFALAAVSIFLAEHFATSRRSEFFYLVGLPAIGWSTVALGFVATVGQWPASTDFWSRLGTGIAVLLLTVVGSISASAISVVAVCLICRWFHKLTGIRLLKYRWNDADCPPSAS